MNIFGVELEYDFLDADQLEAYERENKRVAEDVNDLTQYEGKTNAEAIRIQCRIVDRFFDALFGAGTAQRIFKGKSNIRDHIEAFGIMTEAAMNTKGELEAIKDKYSPNRAERRQAEQRNQTVQKQGSRNFNYHAAGKRKNHNR